MCVICVCDVCESCERVSESVCMCVGPGPRQHADAEVQAAADRLSATCVRVRVHVYVYVYVYVCTCDMDREGARVLLHSIFHLAKLSFIRPFKGKIQLRLYCTFRLLRMFMWKDITATRPVQVAAPSGSLSH